ncbi:hypothetical protein R1flu_019676 [Riccia fluitans]|uniref:Secreted protein n=1 Tax=Riccia fluitans TaxID=41844 RepID=A0ABD1ZJC8_9MARC
MISRSLSSLKCSGLFGSMVFSVLYRRQWRIRCLRTSASSLILLKRDPTISKGSCWVGSQVGRMQVREHVNYCR